MSFALDNQKQARITEMAMFSEDDNIPEVNVNAFTFCVSSV